MHVALFVTVLVATVAAGHPHHQPNHCVNSFKENKVVPDVIDVAPQSTIDVKYDSGVCANLGNVLTPVQVEDIPKVKFDADEDKFYTLAMIDPDAPSRASPTYRSFEHWLVGNIPGCKVSKGETLAEYIGSGPPQGSGLHRYVFLVYQQPCKLKFTETKYTADDDRPQFNMTSFAKKYKLGNPIAGNLFQAQWDPTCKSC